MISRIEKGRIWREETAGVKTPVEWNEVAERFRQAGLEDLAWRAEREGRYRVNKTVHQRMKKTTLTVSISLKGMDGIDLEDFAKRAGRRAGALARIILEEGLYALDAAGWLDSTTQGREALQFSFDARRPRREDTELRMSRTQRAREIEYELMKAAGEC